MTEPAVKPGKVVRPRPLKWHQRAAATALYGTLHAISYTVRYEWRDQSGYVARHPDLPVIYCFWHNRLALCAELRRRYHRAINRTGPMAAMVSASKDGGILARTLDYFGVQPVRGSTSRRGRQALLELTTWAERGYDLAITPDGPRGPCYVVQPGVIFLAQVTGLPIIPMAYHLNWKWQTPSWDRFQVPLPLSRCVVTLGDPVLVPREASDAEREELLQKLQNNLRQITRD